MRRQLPEETIVVEEAARRRAAANRTPRSRPSRRRGAAPRAAARAAAAATPADETLSSQTVINLDQADAVAEADFHMAYGLYDQAAELVQKALEAAPNRRDLKLKLLEVFFMWGNKDAFLKAAQSAARRRSARTADPDWDKVVIMGRQICPDERLFTEADVGRRPSRRRSQAGDSPLDLAFDEAAAGGSVDLDFGLGEADGDDRLRPRKLRNGRARGACKASRGEARQAGEARSRQLARYRCAHGRGSRGRVLRARRRRSRTTRARRRRTCRPTASPRRRSRRRSSGRASSDWGDASRARRRSSRPTRRPSRRRRSRARAPIRRRWKRRRWRRRSGAPSRRRSSNPRSCANRGDYTAEIDLDDLGLDVKDIEGLPSDLGDLPMAGIARERHARAACAARSDDSAVGDGRHEGAAQQRRRRRGDDFEQRKTSVLDGQDATMLAPGFDEGTSTLTGTEVLEHRFESTTSRATRRSSGR